MKKADHIYVYYQYKHFKGQVIKILHPTIAVTLFWLVVSPIRFLLNHKKQYEFKESMQEQMFKDIIDNILLVCQQGWQLPR